MRVLSAVRPKNGRLPCSCSSYPQQVLQIDYSPLCSECSTLAMMGSTEVPFSGRRYAPTCISSILNLTAVTSLGGGTHVCQAYVAICIPNTQSKQNPSPFLFAVSSSLHSLCVGGNAAALDWVLLAEVFKCESVD